MSQIQYTFNKNDEYYTPEKAVLPILKYIKPQSAIWCPFDTEDSQYVKVFEREGFKIYHSHISEPNGDFFTHAPPHAIT